MSLVTCTACRRLVRDAEPSCPFCGGQTPAPVRRPNLGRASRSALLVSAAVALGGPVDACKHIFGADTTPPAPPITGAEPAPIYGGPPPTVLATAYGGPPILPVAPSTDAGADAAHPDAGPRPHITMYGAPPHPRK